MRKKRLTHHVIRGRHNVDVYVWPHGRDLKLRIDAPPHGGTVYLSKFGLRRLIEALQEIENSGEVK